LLGGYRMNVHETVTHVCPDSLCPPDAQRTFVSRVKLLASDTAVVALYTILPEKFTRELPDISQKWSDFLEAGREPAPAAQTAASADSPALPIKLGDRSATFREFIGSIQDSSQPRLDFLHILLPHASWEYLPSGQRHSIVSQGNQIRGIVGDRWSADISAVREGYRRFLWQAMFVDRLVGELTSRLKTIGLYDKCLLVIAADHGASFRPNGERRVAAGSGKSDLLWVPIFIKRPNQREGRIDDRNVETMDILPTVADVLGIAVTGKVDGQSVFSEPWKDRGVKMMKSSGVFLQAPPSEKGLRDSLNFKFNLLPHWELPDGIYRTPGAPNLVGQTVNGAKSSELHYSLDRPMLYRNVRTRSSMVPSVITGTLAANSSDDSSLPWHLAVAVNGVVRSTAATYVEDNATRFTFLVSPKSFHDGKNGIDICSLSLSSGGGAELTRLSGPEEQSYSLGTELQFTRNGNASDFFTDGWSEPGNGLTWSESKHSTLFLPLKAPPANDVELKAIVFTFRVPKRAHVVHVNISVNGTLVGHWKVNESLQEKRLVIPQDLFVNHPGATIHFEVSDAASPQALKAGPDQRNLGFGIVTLSLKETS
jgi:sulfatase-like protein